MATEQHAAPRAPLARIAEREALWRANLMAGLIATSPAGSLFLCVTTGAVFILGWDGLRAVLGGMTIGVLGWVAMGAAATSFLPVDRANRSIHKALTMRMDAMRAGPMPPVAESHLDALAQELGMPRPSAQSEEERRRLITQLQNSPQ